jgi:hypothetical protein
MKTIKVNGKLTNEERETIIVYSGIDKKWYVDTTISKHANRFKKQGWTQTVEYVYEDNTVCGGAFVGSERAITIRNAEKKQMSEKQMENLRTGDNDEEEEE